jgi:hypothetical protein
VRDAEYLNRWRKGKTLLIKWKIRGHVAIIDSTNHLPTFWLDISNINDNRTILPSLDSNAFESKILYPLKLSNMFIEQFPLDMSDKIRNAKGLPPGIAGLINDPHL